MRVCDWIAEFLYQQGIRNIYGLMGGGASGLNDGFIKNGKLSYICFHHEQGAAHAAIGEAKLTGKPAVINPTTGCGGTNCITSVMDAWQDGVPLIIISGNVRTKDCSRHINNSRPVNIRKYGIQEHDIIETVSNITKNAVFISTVDEVENIFAQTFEEIQIDRPGPIWIDIPSDIQTSMMPPLTGGAAFGGKSYNGLMSNWSPAGQMYDTVMEQLEKSERPIILAGQGIKQSNTVHEFSRFVENYTIPFVSTYGARDLMPYSHPLNIGAIGIKGSRAGNFAMQSSDFILSLGCSVNTSHIGYDPKGWAPLAKKAVVDIDGGELAKNIIKWDYRILASLQDFFERSIYA